MPASWPGAGRQHRRRAPPSSAAQPVAQRRRRRRSTAVHDSSTRGRPPAARADVGDHGARRRPRSAPRASSQAVTADGIALTPLGPTPTLPTVASAPRPLGGRPRRQDRGGQRRASGRPGRRAAWCRRGRRAPRRSSRHRPCGQIDAATPTGGAASRSARPCSTCSSTNVPTRRSASSSRPSTSRVVAGGATSPRPSSCRRRRSGRARGRVERAGEQPGPGAGDAEPGALLVGEAGDAHRSAGAAPPGRSRSSAANADTTPERAVEGAAVRAPSPGGCRRRARGRRRPGPPSTPTGCRPGRSRRPGPGPPPRRGTTRAARRPSAGPGEPAVAPGARRPGRPARARPTSRSKPVPRHCGLRHRDADAPLLGHLARPGRSRRPRAGSRPWPGRCCSTRSSFCAASGCRRRR